MRPAAGPRGIGGWLVLPLLGLIGTALLTGYNLYETSQYWKVFFDLAIGRLDPDLRWILIPSFLSFGLGMIVMALALLSLVQFLQKKRSTPKWMIAFYCSLLVATLFESSLVFSFAEFREAPGDIDAAGKEIVRIIFAAMIWIPYFLVSKRVKATFVE